MSIFDPPTTDEHGNCTMILTGMAGGGQLRCVLDHHEPGTYHETALGTKFGYVAPAWAANVETDQ